MVGSSKVSLPKFGHVKMDVRRFSPTRAGLPQPALVCLREAIVDCLRLPAGRQARHYRYASQLPRAAIPFRLQ